MEILFDLDNIYVYKAEPWDLSAFENDKNMRYRYSEDLTMLHL